MKEKRQEVEQEHARELEKMQKIHQETLARIQMQHEDKVRLLISWMPSKRSSRLIVVLLTASEEEKELA